MSVVLVVNSGSSSIKYQLVDPGSGVTTASGLVERIGESDGGRIEHVVGDTTTARDVAVTDHREAMALVVAMFDEVGPALAETSIEAVGHRVVMGGSEIAGAVRVDDELLATVERLSPLAPLHNPPNLVAMEVALELFGDVPHVAVFDTAFFHDLPEVASTYALDRKVAQAYGIRRYGFHGTSHEYVSGRVAEILGRDDLRQVVLHLGNGASASAVVSGRPVETSMGLTPLEGLVMGTRTGDIDPAVTFHLVREAGVDLDEVDDLLNKRSGVLGLSGVSDMRELHRLVGEGDAGAQLALEVYVHRIRKYVGAYAAAMGGIDALTFTAGVGENDAVTRAAVAEGLGFIGIAVDPDRNTSPSREARTISPDGAPVTVMVVPTDEELAIARQTMELLSS